jgi:hypothetical protein
MMKIKLTVTAEAIVQSDAFRNAFNAIAHKALPFMAEDAYHSDLLYDATRAAGLAEGETFFLLVRSMGTNSYVCGNDAIETCPATDGRAVLRITRGLYDNFRVLVIHEERRVAGVRSISDVIGAGKDAALRDAAVKHGLPVIEMKR